MDHFADLVLPGRPLGHLLQCKLFRLFLVHPASLHGLSDQIRIDLVEGQKLPLQVSTMNTVGILRVLGTMFQVRPHGPTTALTLSGERHYDH